MRMINLTEAKAKFSDVIRAVEAGERIALTRHGKPVAYLSPDDTSVPKRSEAEVQEILERARRLRESISHTFTHEEIISARDEGRK